MIVHHDGIVVHAVDQPQLAPLAQLLIGRGYGLGERREILAHALAFESIEGVVREDLLRPEDLADAERALEAGQAEVPLDDPSWGSAAGAEWFGNPRDDLWTPDDTLRALPPELDEDEEDDEDLARLDRRIAEHMAAAPAREPEPCKCHADRSAGDGRSLDQVLEHEAGRYRAWGDALGDFLADQLERIRGTARFCQATTPVEYTDRVEVLEMEARATYYDRGHADPFAATVFAQLNGAIRR